MSKIYCDSKESTISGKYIPYYRREQYSTLEFKRENPRHVRNQKKIKHFLVLLSCGRKGGK